jgi:hypothetical protein
LAVFAVEEFDDLVVFQPNNRRKHAMKSLPVRAALFVLLVAATTTTQAQPYADAGLLPPGPAVVTLSGTLQIRGGLMVLTLDSPVSLQANDGHSVDVVAQTEVEVIGIAATTKDFRPAHVTLSGTLGRGGHGDLISVTVQAPVRTG